MGKKNEEKEFSYNIESYIGSIKESDKHDWAKAVLKIQWGENIPTLDIRNINMSQKRIGKGVSLTNEEADRLVDILLNEDYGTLECLESAIARKREIFSLVDEASEILSDGIYIEIN